jgi:hypothetical protein
MNQSRRNYRKRFLRRTRHRGGVGNTKFNNTQVEVLNNNSWNDISTRPNSRNRPNKLGANNIPYKPMGFRRSGNRTIKKYTCDEVANILNTSNVYKNSNSKVRNILKTELCKSHDETTIEIAKEKALTNPSQKTFKEFMTLAMNPALFGKTWKSRYM